ncbi:MAG TPA: hypothetical protein ENG23_00415 [Methanomicrobia archaeon]|nr:hypothetical protein [Methanomicrobia archaeon]
MKSVEEVVKKITEMGEELKVAMFLTGCRTTAELKGAEVVLTGKARETAEQRGFLRSLLRSP